jgi:hypothetical protein
VTPRRRTGSDSRCCDRQNGPFSWRTYIDGTHPSVQALEAWLSSLPLFARHHEEGEIDALFEAAELGQLYDSGDVRTKIKPIRLDPEIYELRRTALSKALRFYHGEPNELPLDLVAVHRHIKDDELGQQAEIEYAADRYNAGRASRWE